MGRGRGELGWDEGEVVWWVGRYTIYKVPMQFHQKGKNTHELLSSTIPLNTGSEYTTSVPLYSRYTEKNIPSIAPIHTIRIPIKLPARNKRISKTTPPNGRSGITLLHVVVYVPNRQAGDFCGFGLLARPRRQAGNIDRHDNPDKGNKRRPTLCMACAEQMC